MLWSSLCDGNRQSLLPAKVSFNDAASVQVYFDDAPAHAVPLHVCPKGQRIHVNFVAESVTVPFPLSTYAADAIAVDNTKATSPAANESLPYVRHIWAHSLFCFWVLVMFGGFVARVSEDTRRVRWLGRESRLAFRKHGRKHDDAEHESERTSKRG